MRRPTPSALALVAVVLLATAAAAQPPGNTRWTSATAIAPTQGNFSQGTPLTLTWGFMALGTPLNDGGAGSANAPNNLQTRLDTIYGSQPVWQPLFESVFDRWAAVSGLSYQFEANDDGATFTASTAVGQRGVLGTRADVRIGGKSINGNGGVLAYNYFPNVGDMIIDTNDNFYDNTGNNSIRLRNVVSHEHGHGIGMNHVQSNNASFLMEPTINTSFDGPQYHDILAAHHMYGDAREKSNAGLGNDTAARANPLGTLASAPVTIGTSARTLTVAPTATDFVSIDSQTDTDFFSFTVDAPGDLSVLLEALGFTYNLTNQAGAGNVPFNTRERNNLRLGLFDTDGTTLLQELDAAGLGESELLTFALDEGGTYFLRVTGINNPDAVVLDAQFYGLTLNFVPVPEPASALLVAAAGGGLWATRRRRVRGVAAGAGSA